MKEIYIDSSAAEVTGQTETAVLDVLGTRLDSLTPSDVFSLITACFVLVIALRFVFIRRK